MLGLVVASHFPNMPSSGFHGALGKLLLSEISEIEASQAISSLRITHSFKRTLFIYLLSFAAKSKRDGNDINLLLILALLIFLKSCLSSSPGQNLFSSHVFGGRVCGGMGISSAH